MKILIIKTGITETFDMATSHLSIVSLGDVVRATVLLHAFSQDEVTWWTSEASRALLEGNFLIKNVITSFDGLNMTEFDAIINLEREKEILSFLQMNDVKNLLGYKNEDCIVTNKGTYDVRTWMEVHRGKGSNWSEKLYSLIGETWNGENYILPNNILSNANVDEFDIGLNWKVGAKWPSKNWPKERWYELETTFSADYSVSWQEGFDDLVTYMNWINSCKVIVTHDSLGLHLALALNKHVISLFGPTSAKETPLGVRGRALSGEGVSGFDCIPCYKETCHNKIHCMDYLSVDNVARELKLFLKGAHE